MDSHTYDQMNFRRNMGKKMFVDICTHDGINFHGRIGDSLIFLLKLVHNNTERFGIFLKLVHTTDLKVLHLYISMNSGAVNKNTANRIVVGHSCRIKYMNILIFNT
jgi:hypothetical protein